MARVCFCLGSPLGFSSCEGGEMCADRISEFGSRWRRHGLIEVSSRSEWSRGTARAETGELFSSLRRAFVPQQEPGVHGSLRAPAATPTRDTLFSFLCAAFLFFSHVKRWGF